MLQTNKLIKALLLNALTATIILSTIIQATSLNKDESMDFSSPYYQALAAEVKLNKLWNKLSEKQSSYGWYNKLIVLSIFFQDVKKTFLETSDIYLTQRKKLIHSVGVVAKVALIPEANCKFTGIFKGAKNGIIRLSTAKEPDYSKTKAEGALKNFTPGFGIKFFRTKVPSANLVAMYSVEGQSSWNFFKKDFSNHIPDTSDLFLKLLERKFQSAQDEGGVIGVKPLAQYDEQGNEEANVIFPFKLVFKPAENLRNKLTDEFSLTFFEQMNQVNTEDVLYEVFAMEKPGVELVKIGKIVMKSPFIPSEFGDKHLFFQHNFLEYDYKMHPEWKQMYTNSETFRKIHEGHIKFEN